MRVAELQQFLRSLVEPLNASGANKAILADLELACAGLEPFRGQSIKEFASFLARAEEFDRTGVLASAAKPTRTPRASTPKAPKMSTADALAALHSLYDRAGDDDMTHSAIQIEVKKLDALSKGDLDAVALEFGLSKAKTKKDALAAFERKIADRRASHQRLLSIHE